MHPYISIVWELISYKESDFLIGLILVIFVFIPTSLDFAHELGLINNPQNLSPIDIRGNGGGYTLTHFITMLSLGMWLKKRNFKISAWILYSSYLISTFVISLLMYKGFSSSYSYYFILVVIQAVCLFLLFLKFNFNNRGVNFCAESCFSIFCAHTSFFALAMWRKYFITEEHLSGGVFMTTLWMFVTVVAMFVVCLFISVLARLTIGRAKNLLCKYLPIVVLYE